MTQNRRKFLQTASALTTMLAALETTGAPKKTTKNIRVVVWDERQPAQKPSYQNFIGNHIAEHLKASGGFSVISVALDDPNQGISDDLLDNCDVLVWWGHIRQGEISAETGKRIVSRIKSGKMSMVALHASHWATPFMEAMNERTRQVARQTFPVSSNTKVNFTETPALPRGNMPTYETRLTPFFAPRKFPDGNINVDIHLPNCCFPAYRGDGKPSTINILKKEHPIVKNVPSQFEISQTEMYDEPFHVPEPDEVILEERWATGEWFRSGMLWHIGKGKVFYFRPGHELYPVYLEKGPLQIVTNAVRWLGS